MAQQNINIGTANAKQGDNLFTAFTKTEANFTDLYAQVADIGADNVVVVNKESDFPSASGGVITLEDDKVYHLGATIITSNRFVCGTNNVITAGNPFAPALVYTGSDTMFTGSGVSFALDRVIISCGAAKCFDMSAVAGQTPTFGLNIVTIVACQEVGDFDNLRSINITNSGIFSCTDGLNLSGVDNWTSLSILRLRLVTENPLAIGINLNSSLHNGVEIADYILESSVAATGISGLPNSGNINPDIIAAISRCELAPPVVPLVGITEDDIRYFFTSNAGIPNSTVDANPYLTVATTVPITTAGTYVKINQGNWSFTEASRLSVSTDGDIENLLEQEIKVQVNGSVTLEKVGGGSDLLTARLVYNDDPTNTQSAVTELGTDNTNPTNIGLVGIFTLQPGDTISIYVANQDGTADIVVNYAKFAMLRVL